MISKGLTLPLEYVEILLALAEEREDQRRRMSCPLPADFLEAISTVRREVDEVKGQD